MPAQVKELFSYLKDDVSKGVAAFDSNPAGVVLFISLTDGSKRAHTHKVSAANFRDCWKAAIETTFQIARQEDITVRWLRVDWINSIEELTWKTLQQNLVNTKRNYFRYGLSLDRRFRMAFLETELNANAMLYGGPNITHAIIHQCNFLRYAKQRFGLTSLDMEDDQPVWRFSTQAAFIDKDEKKVHLIAGAGRNAGRRIIEYMETDDVLGMIERSSRFLVTQVQSSGRFIYGWHPCFNRSINAYNTLRNASTLYSMIEAWEILRDDELKAAIDRGLDYLIDNLIKIVSQETGELAFLVDGDTEIKLGGNGVSLLALVKYSELTGTKRFLPLMEKLAAGILHMQDPQTGKFVHVLNYPSLTLKDPFRIVYYDGEAAFGLMRLYGLTGDERWLRAVEKAFEYFIAVDHWKAHDHWLSYATNELTRYRPRAEYFEFGLKNVSGYLDFVIDRITTFPTLLELMMAARHMLDRLQNDPEFEHLLEVIDLEKFSYALETRAHYLMNGHFWPELAMFYPRPEYIEGSFFIRHHAFRIRIDDIEHYLSGLIAYLQYRRSQAIEYKDNI